MTETKAFYKDLPLELGDTLLLRRATAEDALQILGDIRDEDVAEWEASVTGGIFWLEECLRTSDEAVTLADRASNVPLVIFGCHDKSPLPADIWMVASVFGPARANVGWYLSIDWINEFWDRWPDVHCNSHIHNVVHHRWLDWLGFERGTWVRPWGVKGEHFIYFRRIDANVRSSIRGSSGHRGGRRKLPSPTG